jgi:hypothetical protein
VAKAARERLARLLSGEEAGAFSGQVSLPADVLRLEVAGVGPIRLPVKPAQAAVPAVQCSWWAPRREHVISHGALGQPPVA